MEYYASGTVMKQINLEIVSLEVAGDNPRNTTYRVRTLCCGAERDIKHNVIRDRFPRYPNGAPERCARCADKKRHAKDGSYTELHGIWCPSVRAWPVPESVARGGAA